MQRFSVFIKSKKIHWDPDLIILGLTISLGVIYFINSNFDYKYYDYVVKFISIIVVTIYLGALIRKFYMLGKPEKLHGKLEGFLEFHKDFIINNKDKIELCLIEKISIINNDFYGKRIGNGRGFSSNFSSGVDNHIKIVLNDKTEINAMFEIYNEYEMGKLQDILVDYYKLNLISIENLKTIFKLNKKQFIEFKEYVESI